MNKFLFYADGSKHPVEITDPNLGWIREHLKETSFIKMEGGSGILMYKDGYYPHIEYESDIALRVLGIWEKSWEHSCPTCNEELVGNEVRLGYCIECAHDMLENLAACKR